MGSGSTLLNLACSGTWEGAFQTGKYSFLVGDSSSGKTFLALTCFAEATYDKRFDDYRLIYDDVEAGAGMDFQYFFGSRVANRVEPPAIDEDNCSLYSQTVEDFYYNLDDALDHEKPCIYVLDSMDALSSTYEGERFDMRKKADRGDKKAPGDYGDGKAKINSSHLRAVMPKLRDTGSILIIINQTRDNVGGGIFEAKNIRSGGRSLTFYATLELWSSVGKKIDRTYNGKPRQIGVYSKIKIKKNRQTGRERTIEIPIYYDYGIDDITGCIEFLLTEKVWTKSSNMLDTKGFVKDKMSLKKLIKLIEAEGREDDLRKLTADAYFGVEEALRLGRKQRYE